MAKPSTLTAGSREVARDALISPRDRWWRGARDTVHGYLFLAPFMLFYLVFLVWPLIQGAWISLHRWELIGAGTRFTGLENYQRLLTDNIFWSSLWHTVQFVLLVVPPLVALGLLFALLINRPRPLMGVYRAALYLPAVLSVSVLTTIWLRIYEPNFGLLANWFHDLHLQPIVWLQDLLLAMPAVAVATIWWSVGGNMLLFLAGLQDIPGELYEAARLDGASAWGLFRHITIPALRRSFTIATIVTVIGSLQVFGQVYTMTRGGPIGSTRTLVMYIYETSFRDYQLGYGSALAYTLFVIIFVFSMIQFRFFSNTEAQTER